MDLPITQWAGAKMTNEFIIISAYSGYRSSRRDPDGQQFILTLDVSDEDLGARVLEVLSSSRFLPLDEVDDFFNFNRVKSAYEAWVNELMDKCNYKSRRALFKNMKSCSLERENGLITIRPSKHEKLEGWSGDGFTEQDYEILTENVSNSELGQALKRCFEKCR